MTLSEELAGFSSVFIDTAPIIYYIQAHPEFGPLAREVVIALESGSLTAYSSVLTLTEVLIKPVAIIGGSYAKIRSIHQTRQASHPYRDIRRDSRDCRQFERPLFFS